MQPNSQLQTPHGKPRLLDRVRQAIQALHYSRRTEKAYVSWIKRFIFFNGKRHPDELDEEEVTAFLNYLAVELKVSASTQNQARNAILFLYKTVLGRELDWLEGIVHAKGPHRLPVVLTQAEVVDLLRHIHGTPWLIASLMYGSGLRLLECCRLRIKDVDFARLEITVRDGKGQKDRVDSDAHPAREAPNDPPRARSAAARARLEDGRRLCRASLRLSEEEPLCRVQLVVAVGLSGHEDLHRRRIRKAEAAPSPRNGGAA